MTESVDAVIADDEPLARARLRRLIEADGRVRVVGEYGDGAELLAAVEGGLAPAATFLDIRMPGIDGLRVAERLPPGCALVFSTAYGDHAVRAYRLDAVDYLVKPIDQARVSTAIGRVLRRRLQHSATTEPDPLTTGSLPLRVGRNIRRVGLDDVLWVRADGDHVVVVTPDNEYALRTSLRGLASELSDPRFVRCHRAALVNMDHVRSFRPEGSAMVAILTGGEEVPVSRRYARSLRCRLGRL